MIYQGKSQYPVREVMLHCAGVSTGYFHKQTPFQVFSTINKWHHERGWKNGFGYHALVMPDGNWISGRPREMVGAGCIGKNQGVFHLLMIESRRIGHPVSAKYETPDWLAEQEPLFWFDPPCLETAAKIIRSLPGIEKVSGHNDYAAKLCPGFKVKSGDWLK
jgi:hypothetical protein